MGLIPIHVYSDVPWVPYIDTFREVGYVVHISKLEELLSMLLAMSDEEVLEREANARRLFKSHFTFEGAIKHIGRFLLHGELGSELRCHRLPPSTRGDYWEEGCEHLVEAGARGPAPPQWHSGVLATRNTSAQS